MDYLIKGGGYSSKICVKSSNSIVIMKDANKIYSQNCTMINESCPNGLYYICEIPCGSDEPAWKINGKIKKFDMLNKPIFEISMKKPIYKSNDELIINVKEAKLSLFLKDEIKLNFSDNVSCSNKTFHNETIKCQLDLSQIRMSSNKTVNINILYGKNCDKNTKFNDVFIVEKDSNFRKFLKKYYWIFTIISFVCFALILTCIFVIKHEKTRKNAMKISGLHKKQLEEQELIYVKAQKQAFLEYQTAVKSFGNLGKLTPRYILSFNDYTSRIFNVELNEKSKDNENDNNLKLFQDYLLTKTSLIKWVDEVEKHCQIKQRSLVASLLTLVLFQHPDYFLDVMKSLLSKSIEEMKINSEEKLLFRRTDRIIECIIGNWISLCMYQILKTGEIGKRLFNLFRAIKCKMETGFVDVYVNKAKYALTFDHVMFGDLEYYGLNIIVNVHIQINLMDSTQKPLEIFLENLNVQVISLDTISQVKCKILDKAIITFVEKENPILMDDNMNYAIAKTDHNELSLKMINKTTKIPLEDFDYTSITTNEGYTLVNTFKHYNMKDGMKFLLTSLSFDEGNCLTITCQQKSIKTAVHVQMPSDFKMSSSDAKIESNSPNIKLPIKPIFGETNKETHLMNLLVTKKSLSPFIDGFFESLTTRIPDENLKSSNNLSLENVDESQITDRLINETSFTHSDNLVLPVYYLFSFLDEIAKELDITDEVIIKVWKSNSYILRFWINIIKNPNFIFSIDKSDPIDGSLTTIASVLMESCSYSSSNVDINSPIIKQLFLEDVKDKYSAWWRSFVDSVQPISDDYMASMMMEIKEKYKMEDHYFSHLRSLLAINNKLNANKFDTDNRRNVDF